MFTAFAFLFACQDNIATDGLSEQKTDPKATKIKSEFGIPQEWLS